MLITKAYTRRKMLEESLNKWLKIDPARILKEILSDRAILDWIEEANRKQLLDGKNSLDVKLSDIGGGYSDYTLSINPEKQRDRVNLFDTGEFHDSITAKVNDLVSIEADPIKVGDNGNLTNLYDEWGVDIIGLNEENFNNLLEQLTEILIDKILEEV
jgi:hypothetical protein